MQHKHRKTFFRWIKWSLIILFFLVLFSGWWVWQRAYPFLAINRPVENPEIAIVEGWLSYRALKVVYEEALAHPNLKLIIIGSGRGHHYFSLGGHPQSSWNSYLDRQFDFPCQADTLYISAWANKIDEERGHLRVLVNEHLIGEFFPGRYREAYKFPVPPKAGPIIEKLTVHMDNTNVSEGGKVRRAFFNRVALDTLPIPLFSDHTSYAFISSNIEKFETPQNENSAIYGGRTLERMGLQPSRLIILPTSPGNRSRTHGAALEVENWLKNSPQKYRRFVLYSQAAHARRSYEMMRKTLPDSVKIGVVALRDYRYDENWTSTRRGRKLMIEQIVKYFLSKILIF